MAIESKTKKTYIADGTQSVFLFPFDYLRKSFVYVTLNGSTLLQGTDFSIVNKQVIFSTAPTGTLAIFRQTATSPLVSWSDGSVLLANDLTVQMVQALHLSEETADMVGTDLAGLVDTAVEKAAEASESAGIAVEKAAEASESAGIAVEKAAEAAASAASLVLPVLLGGALKFLRVRGDESGYELVDAAITIDELPTDGSANAVSSGGVFAKLVEKLSITAAFMSGYKNKIINGNFDVWQRGMSQSTGGYRSDDRWANIVSGSTIVHSQQLFAPGQTAVPGEPKFFSRTVVTSVAGANNYAQKYQAIESVRTLAGKAAVLSFFAKADSNKNMAIELLQDFGTGGSPSALVRQIGVTKVSLTSSWQKFVIPISIPSIAGKTIGTDENDNLRLAFFFDAGASFDAFTNSLGQQSGTFDIARVQLEEGFIETPFESRHIAQEIALCQRYHEILTGRIIGTYAASGETAAVCWQFLQKKRATPTAALVGCTGTVDNVTTDHLVLFVAPGTPVVGSGTSVSAEL